MIWLELKDGLALVKLSIHGWLKSSWSFCWVIWFQVICIRIGWFSSNWIGKFALAEHSLGDFELSTGRVILSTFVSSCTSFIQDDLVLAKVSIMYTKCLEYWAVLSLSLNLQYSFLLFNILGGSSIRMTYILKSLDHAISIIQFGRYNEKLAILQSVGITVRKSMKHGWSPNVHILGGI